MLNIEIPGYRIQRPLGRGGMAGVYLAEQLSLNRDVALKLLSPALAADSDFVERFKREARLVAQLNHPNIVAIYDIGAVKDQVYLALEYVSGGDLRGRLDAGAMPPKKAFAVVAEIAGALKRAHGQQIVHRDIKPENILFRPTGEAVVADFGIAKAVDVDTRLTQTGMVVGSPYYMSPEQGKGQAVDGRTDLYSLGAVLYEMLTGRVPYEAPDTFSLALKHFIEPIPTLPPELSSYQPLLDRLMAKEPEDRFADADALLEAIDGLELQTLFDADGQTTEVFTAPVGWDLSDQDAEPEDDREADQLASAAPVDLGESSPSGSRRWLYLGAAAVLVALAVGVLTWRPFGSAPDLSESAQQADNPAPRSPAVDSAQPEAPTGQQRVRDLAEDTENTGLPTQAPVVTDQSTPRAVPSAQSKDKQAAQAHDRPDRNQTRPPVDVSRSGLDSGDAPVTGQGAKRPSGSAASAEQPNAVGAKAKPAPAKAGITAIAPELVSIPKGCFQMGSPASESGRETDEGSHRVCVNAFELGKYEVTVGEFRRFVEATGYQTDAERNAGGRPGCRALGELKNGNPWDWRAWANWDHLSAPERRTPDRQPVGCVSANDAEAYIAWLNQQTSARFRLPSEAEWEYAARAGTSGARYWGEVPEDACRHANVADQTALPNASAWQGGHSCSDGQPFGARVGEYEPNAWGMHDMLGNVWEWTCSAYQIKFDGSEQRCQPGGAQRLAIRGGGWNNDPRWVRSANRYWSKASDRFANLGFRLAKDQ